MLHKHEVHLQDQWHAESRRDRLNSKWIKNIEIDYTQNFMKHNNISAVRPSKTIAYDTLTLKCIRDNMQHDHRYKILPFGMVNMVRELGLNHKKIKNRKAARNSIKQNGLNWQNLINVKKEGSRRSPNLVIGTCNVQAIKRKELEVSHLIHNHALDILKVTDTWLTSEDDLWKKATDLNKNNLQLHAMDRGHGKGGGIALICKKSTSTSHSPSKTSNL